MFGLPAGIQLQGGAIGEGLAGSLHRHAVKAHAAHAGVADGETTVCPASDGHGVFKPMVSKWTGAGSHSAESHVRALAHRSVRGSVSRYWDLAVLHIHPKGALSNNFTCHVSRGA